MITPFKKLEDGELLGWQKEFNKQVNKIRYYSSSRSSRTSRPGGSRIPITVDH
jgi:hypothetical protein